MKTSTLVLMGFILLGPFFTETAHAATTTALTQTEVETRVREYFKDAPAMIEIARCESKFRQFTDAGNPLRSAGMIGVFQFYEAIHASGALSLGFDLTTLEGNLGYAKHIYKTEGTAPWSGSRYCWETSSPVATKTMNREALLKQIETLTKIISLLQKQLELKNRS